MKAFLSLVSFFSFNRRWNTSCFGIYLTTVTKSTSSFIEWLHERVIYCEELLVLRLSRTFDKEMENLLLKLKKHGEEIRKFLFRISSSSSFSTVSVNPLKYLYGLGF